MGSALTSLNPNFCFLSGVPAVVVATTLAIAYRVDNPLGYRQEELWVHYFYLTTPEAVVLFNLVPFDPRSCWLAALDKNKSFDYSKPMFWGFLVPVGVILVYNLVLLVLTSMTTCKTNKSLQR